MIGSFGEIIFEISDTSTAVIEKSSETLIGTVMFQPVHDKAIIGYSIDEQFWNKGYATRIINLISKELKSRKYMLIEAWVKKENIASSKALLKNNFQAILFTQTFLGLIIMFTVMQTLLPAMTNFLSVKSTANFYAMQFNNKNIPELSEIPEFRIFSARLSGWAPVC